MMPGPRPTARRKATSGLTTTLTIVAASGASVLLLDKTFWPKCPVFALTGFFCPGCGGLRATDALFHADFAGAFNQNALILLMPVLIGAGFAAQHFQKRWLTVTVISCAAFLTMAFVLLRNLPGSWLAPN